METLKPGPLARALERGRRRFNAMFADVKLRQSRLDAAEFSEHLVETLDPIVRQIEAVDPGRVDEATEELFAISLELFASGLLGGASPQPEIAVAWRDLFPRIARLLASAPRRVAAGVINAAHNLSRQSPSAARRWLDRLIGFDPTCPTPEVFLEVGKVVAWQVGLAHYRESALDAWRGLDPQWRRLSLGLPDDFPLTVVELDRALADPWYRPGGPVTATSRPLRLIGHVGGFRGMNGLFLAPPELFVADDAIHVSDGERGWVLHADSFGLTLQKGGTEKPSDQPEPRWRLDHAGRVHGDRRDERFPQLKSWCQVAVTGDTMAVTLKNSYYVFVVAPGEPITDDA